MFHFYKLQNDLETMIKTNYLVIFIITTSKQFNSNQINVLSQSYHQNAGEIKWLMALEGGQIHHHLSVCLLVSSALVLAIEITHIRNKYRSCEGICFYFLEYNMLPCNK